MLFLKLVSSFSFLVYRSTVGFCILTFCSLLNSRILILFLCRFLRIFYFNDHVCEYGELYIFLAYIHVCIFYCFFLISLVRTISTLLNTGGESRDLSMFPILRENIQSFTIKYDVKYKFFILPFTDWGNPFHSWFVECCYFSFLNHEWVLSFIRCFFLHLLRWSYGLSLVILECPSSSWQ